MLLYHLYDNFIVHPNIDPRKIDVRSFWDLISGACKFAYFYLLLFYLTLSLKVCHVAFGHMVLSILGKVWSSSPDTPYHLEDNILPFGAKKFTFDGLWATYMYRWVKNVIKNQHKVSL